MKNTGIITRQSTYSVKETIDKLQALIEGNGATVYARIDQQAELKNAGITILPLEFILFGNPVAGGRLMLENPVVALDLPLKIIAWEDEQQKVWLAYNEAGYIQERYGLKPDSNSPLGLDKLVSKALNISIS
jgi:uncharacterized protein (DUF302 family)